MYSIYYIGLFHISCIVFTYFMYIFIILLPFWYKKNNKISN